MSGKQKLFRFEQMKSFPHVFEEGVESFRADNFRLKGKWRADFFENQNPIILELACGKGEYSLSLASKNPDVNYIGIDIKGARMYVGAKSSLDQNLKNIAFLRTRIEFISAFFEPNEVDEIWLVHPDPQLKKGREKKRLTSPEFVDRFRRILKPEGIVRLKTDSFDLYEYSLKEIEDKKYTLLEAYENVYAKLDALDDALRYAIQIPTHYEKLFVEKGHKIHYLSFKP